MTRPAGAARAVFLAAIPVLALGSGPPARAAEIDNFTGRHDGRLRDATWELNVRVNHWLREGVERANATSAGCDEYELRRQLRDAISFPFIGHWIAEKLNEAPELDKRRVLLEDSIYRDLGLLEAVSVHWKDLSAVVRMGEAQVGVDKIGHFFVEGWRYYEIARLEEEGVAAAMDWGESAERSYFGLVTTGIYSHADLVTNFEGLRFWMHLRGEDPDPLGRPAGADPPYVVCAKPAGGGEGTWRLRRDVDLGDYVTPAWDEAVNCNRYRGAELAERIHARVAELGPGYRCPVEPAACADARDRYGPYAERLLHPRCLAAQRPWWRRLWPGHW